MTGRIRPFRRTETLRPLPRLVFDSLHGLSLSPSLMRVSYFKSNKSPLQNYNPYSLLPSTTFL